MTQDMLSSLAFERDIGESSSGNSDGPRASVSDNPIRNSFKHKVSKLDTLAGIAIKYNVTVADVKRVNGLHNESAIFARDTLLIPQDAQPTRQEHDMHELLSQLVSSLGRDHHLTGSSPLNAGSSTFPRLHASITPESSLFLPYEGDPMPRYLPDADCPWWCSCDATSTPPDALAHSASTQRRHAAVRPGSLELMDRSAVQLDTYSPSSSGATRMHEAVRRRRGSGSGEERPLPQQQGGGWKAASLPHQTGHQAAVVPELFSMSRLAQLAKSIGQSPLLQKLRKAASSPALSHPGGMLRQAGHAATTQLQPRQPTSILQNTSGSKKSKEGMKSE